jgi:cytochrome oxidase Cu insertion factor (SCO1/SenC/PrrC family)
MRLRTAAVLAAAFSIALSAQQPASPTQPEPLKAGAIAPNFTLPSTAGGKVTLSDYKGKNVVVLAFFPAAFTGG